MDLTKEIIEEIDRQEKTGELQEKVRNNVNKLIEEVLKDLTDPWGSAYKTMKNKLEEIMCKSIENYNFSDYLTKFTYIIDEAMKNPIVEDYKRVGKNIKALFGADNIPEKITMRQLLEYYRDAMMENSYDSDQVEDDGEGYGFIKFTIEQERESYGGTFIFKTLGKDDEEIEDNRVTISIWEDHFDRGVYHISAHSSNEISSIRYMSAFEIILLSLEQRFVKITEVEDYDEIEDSVSVSD